MSSTAKPRHRGSSRWLWAVVCAAVLGLGGMWWHKKHAARSLADRTPARQKSKRKKHPRPPHAELVRADVEQYRVRDFYSRQAESAMHGVEGPELLAQFPGIDGPEFSHFGRMTDEDWRDRRWNDMDSGAVMCGVLNMPDAAEGAPPSDEAPVAKAVCVMLGDDGEAAACFDPENGLALKRLWKGQFVKFTLYRFGLLRGMKPAGEDLPLPAFRAFDRSQFVYHGFYRFGNRVVFTFSLAGKEMLASPWIDHGEFQWQVAPAGDEILAKWTRGGPAQWPERIATKGTLGKEHPYALDTLALPFENPWQSLMFLGDHDFFSNGDAAVCTLMGDVWIVHGIDHDLRHLTWKRFASGLHQPLGLKIINDEVYVLGRDQITKLRDLNGDEEADFYECVTNAYETSPSGHSYITGLQTDAVGRFCFASATQGVCRVKPGDTNVEVLATGIRNPNGIALGPKGQIWTSAQEGDWTPASMICEIQKGAHYGWGGIQPGAPGRTPPLCFLPRGLDHSSGAEVFADSPRWGPLNGHLIHFSYGACAHMLVLRDTVEGTTQGAALPLPGEFRSGSHRARFSPKDGQLYVSGTRGWGTYAHEDGCLQRVRYTGEAITTATGFHAWENGLELRFNRPLDRSAAMDARNYFAQQWNYLYTPGYGSPEYSLNSPTTAGHDRVGITSAHLSEDGMTLFLEIPQLVPVDQLHLHIRGQALLSQDVFFTLLRLGPPFTQFPGYQAVAKMPPPPRPIFSALAYRPNPWTKGPAGREVVIHAAPAFHLAPDHFVAQRGERLSLKFENPDVIPHNLAILQPGTVSKVGNLANRMIDDPEALTKDYVPVTPEVLFHTSMINPGRSETINFNAPKEPGDYPFLCTFPGHWQVMQGTMSVR